MDLKVTSEVPRPPATPAVRWERLWTQHQAKVMVAVVGLAVVPTLVWGLVGAGYLSDDYWIAIMFEDLGSRESLFRIAFVEPGRPVASPYYWLMYDVVGQVPVAHVLALAAANAAMVLSLRSLGRLFLEPHVLLPALLIFAALPNHATTRLWFVVATYPLAVAAVAWAGALLVRGRGTSACLLLAAGVLLYEGVAGFAVGVIALVCWRFRDRFRLCGAAAVVTLVVSVVMYLLSPKASAQERETYPGPFRFVDSLLPAQIGEGITHYRMLGALVFAVVLVILGAASVRLLPSFGPPRPLDRLALVGGALLVVGAAPMVVGGSYFAASGLNDRNNLVPSIGAALLFSAAVIGIGRRSPIAGAGALLCALAAFSVASLHDVDIFRKSLVEGRAFEAAVVETFGDTSDYAGDTVVVSPSLRAISGTAAFVNDIDIQGALRLRHGGDWSFLHLDQRFICGTTESVLLYDWRSRTLRQGSNDDC